MSDAFGAPLALGHRRFMRSMHEVSLREPFVSVETPRARTRRRRNRGPSTTMTHAQNETSTSDDVVIVFADDDGSRADQDDALADHDLDVKTP